MARETSINAYQEIKNNGLLSKRRWEVYDLVCQHGPLTGGELIHIIKNNPKKYVTNSGTYATRLSELRTRQVIRELPKRKCKITGYLAIEWESTGNLPIPIQTHKKQNKILWIFCPRDLDEKWTYYSTKEGAQKMKLKMSGTIYEAIKG